MSREAFKWNGRAWVYLGFALLLFLPVFLSRFYIYLASLAVLYGLFAMSLNIPLGYGGIYQFGHAVFFGIGAYGAALVIVKAELAPWIGFIVGPIISALLSVVMGAICIRLSKLYFGMLQISLGYLVWVVAYRWHDFTGGDDGIHGIPMPDIIFSPTRAYYFTLLVAAGCLMVIHKLIRSPFGTVLQSVRDNPVRSEMIGVNVRLHQLATLIVGGFFAGVAGVLFVVVDKSVFPAMLFWTVGMEVMIMCLLGGMYTFMGPMLGAALIVVLRTFISSYTVYLGLVLGTILILVIFFLPDGVLGYVNKRSRKSSEMAEG